MKANIVDLRYKMKDVIKALNRREHVEIIYRGRAKGVIIPVNEQSKKAIKSHPLFGFLSQDKKPVLKVMEELRGGRHAF